MIACLYWDQIQRVCVIACRSTVHTDGKSTLKQNTHKQIRTWGGSKNVCRVPYRSLLTSSQFSMIPHNDACELHALCVRIKLSPFCHTSHAPHKFHSYYTRAREKSVSPAEQDSVFYKHIHPKSDKMHQHHRIAHTNTIAGIYPWPTIKAHGRKANNGEKNEEIYV